MDGGFIHPGELLKGEAEEHKLLRDTGRKYAAMR